jgi:glyoxylase-like metal-dependent hydrolase (beta-lactamase superfamily II)
MRVADGFEMLEITATVMGNVSTFCPSLLWDEENVVLVDTGLPGQVPLFQAALEQAGLALDRLTHIVITHQDIDHIGGLPGLLGAVPHKVQVLSNAIEKPYIEGEKRLVKMSPAAVEKAMAGLPPDTPDARREAFRQTLENPPKAPVDAVLADGEILPVCGGIIAIDTPGHTPGHMSFYHQPSKCLIAGDAMVVSDGHLQGPNPRATADMATALRSLGRLRMYDIETVSCYHGGLFRGNANDRIAVLAGGVG